MRVGRVAITTKTNATVKVREGKINVGAVALNEIIMELTQ